jgi:aspartate carbamoyltransferase catalytic subunit
MKLASPHLLGIEQLEPSQIALILDTAKTFAEVGTREIKKVPTLRGKTVVNFFVEPSTRTRSSFELAEKRLSADAVNFSASQSSFSKGETLLDTARNLEAMAPDYIVIRHSQAGAPHFLARHCRCSYTIREHKGRLDGLRVAIVGDVRHSRVARSNVLLLSRMGAEVVVAAPPTLLPPGIERLGCSATHDLDQALEGADVVMALRIQLERMTAGYLPSLREYAKLYGVSARRLARAAPDAIVMHPGPMNRGVEIASEVADGARSVILEQVTNGVAVRMAVLYLLQEPERDAAA